MDGNGWLIRPNNFSGSRFDLILKLIYAETATGHVLTGVFHRQWESLTENSARFARKSHRFRPPKSGQILDKGRFLGNKSLL
jgi:hypothetical protein